MSRRTPRRATLVERQLTATAALGITTVVAAGDTGSSACARGVKPSQLTSSDKKPQVSWPASSPWVLAVGGTNLTLDAGNGIASTGPWNDTVYPAPFNKAAGGGGGQSTFETRPWWQPAQSFASSKYRMVPDLAAFADESPGYPIVCSSGVQSCPGGPQGITFVGGTSASTPLVAGMVALWAQQARNQGLPKPGFVPPLLYALAQHSPGTFVDVTTGSNALFGGSCCPARPGLRPRDRLGIADGERDCGRAHPDRVMRGARRGRSSASPSPIPEVRTCRSVSTPRPRRRRRTAPSGPPCSASSEISRPSTATASCSSRRLTMPCRSTGCARSRRCG